jgi:hypothetical protein
MRLLSVLAIVFAFVLFSFANPAVAQPDDDEFPESDGE